MKTPRFSQFLWSRLALQQTAPADHPQPDMLAAFAEQSLSADERAKVLDHLAHCPECREVLAVLSTLGPEEIRAGSGPVRRFAWQACYSAVAAILMIAVGVAIWRTALIRHAPPEPEFVARATVRPPQVMSAPSAAKQMVTEPPRRTKKQPSAKRPALANNSIAFKQQTPDVIPPFNILQPNEATAAPKRLAVNEGEPAAGSLSSPAQPQTDSPAPNGLQPSTEQATSWRQAESTLLPKPASRLPMRAAPLPNSVVQAETHAAPAELAISLSKPQRPGSLWRLSGDEGALQNRTMAGRAGERFPSRQALISMRSLRPDPIFGQAAQMQRCFIPRTAAYVGTESSSETRARRQAAPSRESNRSAGTRCKWSQHQATAG